MTGPPFGIRLTIDSTGSAAGAALHVKSIEQIKAANAGAITTIGQLTAAQQRLGTGAGPTVQQLRVMTENLTKMGVSTKDLQGALNRVDWSKFTLPVREAAAAVGATGTALDRVTHAAGDHVTGLSRIERSLSGVAVSALGVDSRLGHLGAALLAFGGGGAVVIAVAAGLAVIGGAYEFLTRQATEAKKKIDDLIDSLHKQREEARGALQDEGAANAGRIRDLEAQRKALLTPDLIGGVPVGRASDERILEINKQLAELYANQFFFQDKSSKISHDAAIAALITELNLHKATTADLALRAKFIADDTALLNQQGITDVRRAELQQEINTLTEAGTKKTREAADSVDRYAEAIAHLRLVGDPGGLKTLAPGAPYQTDRGAFGGFITPENQRLFAEQDRVRAEQLAKDKAAAKERAKILNDAIQDVTYNAEQVGNALIPIVYHVFGTPEQLKAAQQRFEAALRTTTDSLQRGFATLFSGKNPFDSLVQFAQQAAAAIAASFTIRALGIDDLLKKITAFKPSTGTLPISQVGNAEIAGGGGTGLLGPLAVVGGVALGIFTSILGSAAKAREQAKAAAEAQHAYNLTLADLVAIAHPRGELGDALANLTRQIEQIQKAAAAIPEAQGRHYDPGLHGGRSQVDEAAQSVAQLQQELDALNKAIAAGGSGRGARDYVASLLKIAQAEDDARKAIAERIALERQQFSEDLSVRALRAQGLSAEADAAEFQLKQQREFEALVEANKSSSTEAEKAAQQALFVQLGYVQQLEREARIKDQLNQTISAGLALDAQILAAKGDTRGALAATFEQQTFDIREQYRKGLISEANELKALTLAGLTYTNGLQAIQDAMQATQEDLAVRKLVAQGQTEAADALRFAIDQQREYSQAVKDGADATTLAMIAQVQGMEAAARAAKKLADALAAEKQVTDDLAVRHLRATGQAAAADDLARSNQNAAELANAIAQGLSQDTINSIRKTQGEERAFADQQRRDAQQQAYDEAITKNFGLTSPSFAPDSPTTVNLAIGASESTASRLAGFASSQLAVLQAQLAIQTDMRALLRELVLQGRGGGTAGADSWDDTLAFDAADGTRVAGYPVSNR